MAFCTNCGTGNASGARFCAQCGVPLAGESPAPAPVDKPPGEARKIVTILFADVAGSTQLGERLDPESVRSLMGAWFAEARRVVERHGGTVEKFIGDAVMAVFGIPAVHEDDAVRAVRAASEIGPAVERLNDQFEARWGVRLRLRMGINTGEVVAGDPELGHGFVAGDAVNVAARLERAAREGQILVGEPTYRLTRDACVFAAEHPVALRGKSEPLPVWRVVDVQSDAPAIARRSDTPLVGRARELMELEAAFNRVVLERSCRLVTVVGPAGIGKSRLADELLVRMADRANSASGRCLPYGTITYWPVREVVTQLCEMQDGTSGTQAQREIAARIRGGDAEAIAARVTEAVDLGGSTAAPSADDTFWAIRRLLESAARETPLIVVFDDIQWGEPTFLDLVEYLVSFLREAPVLIVCLARRELFETRPEWGAASAISDSIVLDALAADEVDALLSCDGLPRAVADRIAGSAEGNPLFLAEMQRMLVDEGLIEQHDGAWRATRDFDRVPVPPTINAVLSARLDRLDPDERGLLQRAAVIGREFGWAAVADLGGSGERGRTGARLQGLVRKGFLRPRPSSSAGGEMFEFAHILMRDVAYDSIPKAARVEIHERLADWLADRRDGDGAEEMLLGYHLEQAHRHLAELGAPDERARGLAERGAGHLAAAGTRAYDRGDLPAAIDLIDRALALTADDDPLKLRLLPTLGDALCERGDLARAEEVLTEAVARADAVGDRGARHHALVLRAYARSFMEGGHGVDELRRVAEEALRVFEELGDEAGLARAWQSIAIAHVSLCQWAEVELARRRELWHARRAGDRGMVLRALSALAYALYFGPTPVGDAVEALEAIAAEVEGYPVAEATILSILGALNAMRGEIDKAADLHRRGYALSEQLGALPAGEGALNWADTELLRGDPEAAERLLRRAFETLDRAGETAILASVAAALADALHLQGRDDDAWLYGTISQRAADSDDIGAQAAWRANRARILAARGDDAQAEDLARQAVTLTHGTDDLNLSAHALMTLADVLAERAPEDAAAAAAEAVALYERKGNVVAKRQAEAAVSR